MLLLRVAAVGLHRWQYLNVLSHVLLFESSMSHLVSIDDNIWMLIKSSPDYSHFQMTIFECWLNVLQTAAGSDCWRYVVQIAANSIWQYLTVDEMFSILQSFLYDKLCWWNVLWVAANVEHCFLFAFMNLSWSGLEVYFCLLTCILFDNLYIFLQLP